MYKKKLLISLGCSFTQGNGIYKRIPNIKNIKQDTKEFDELESSSNYDMLYLGWPSQLQELLNIDFLINFGKGGSSNAESVRRLVDSIGNHSFDEYDVTIAFLVTFPHRIGFYKNLQPVTFQFGTPISNVYIKEIENGKDFTLDTIFHIKMLSEFCKNRNYKLVCGLLDGEEYDLYKNELKYNEVKIINNPIPHKFEDSRYHSIIKWDSHPNELGYGIMAKTFADEMEDYRGNSNKFKKIRYNEFAYQKRSFFK